MADASLIESLPVEILEHIVSYLFPTQEERRHTPSRNSEFLLDPPRFPYEIWKRDAKNVRLTCNLFSQLHTPCSALFHDFIFWVSPRSLRHPQSLSEHKILRYYVRRVVFVQPMFNAPLLDFAVYHINADPTLEAEIRTALLSDEEEFHPYRYYEVHHDRSPFYKPLSRLHSTVPHAKLKAGHKRFISCYETQRGLLNDGSFIEDGGAFLSKLPKLESIHISAENGDERQQLPGHKNMTWLQTRHPNVLLEYRGLDEVDNEPCNDFVAKVFQTLAVGNVKIRELAFIENHGIDSDYDWNSLHGWPDSNALSGLRKLDLSLRFMAEPPHLRDFVNMIMPLTEKMRNLEELYLQAMPLIHGHDDGSFDELLAMRFPQLKLFHWDTF